MDAMDRDEAVRQLRDRCDEIAKVVTSMHGDVGHLERPPVQTEILKALFELTKQVEVVKKHLIRLYHPASAGREREEEMDGSGGGPEGRKNRSPWREPWVMG